MSQRLLMSHLIRSYTVCHSVFDFTLKPLFASVDMSKFKDGRMHFRNSGMKRLRQEIPALILSVDNNRRYSDSVNFM